MREWRYGSAHSYPRHYVQVSCQLYAARHCTPGERVIQVPYDTLAIRSVQGYEPGKPRIAKFEVYSQQVAHVFTFRKKFPCLLMFAYSI